MAPLDGQKLACYRGTVVSLSSTHGIGTPHRGRVKKASCVPDSDTSPSFLHTLAAKHFDKVRAGLFPDRKVLSMGSRSARRVGSRLLTIFCACLRRQQQGVIDSPKPGDQWNPAPQNGGAGSLAILTGSLLCESVELNHHALEQSEQQAAYFLA